MCGSCARSCVCVCLVTGDGLTEAEAAERMGLTTQVRSAIVQERDRRELKAFTRNWVDTAAVRAFVEQELSRDPNCTRSELAHWLNMQQIDFDRLSSGL